MIQKKLNLVLVNSYYASNIGLCSRAMGNMGFEQLILIAPHCDIDSLEARQRATNNQSLLSGSRIYPDWSAFLKEESGLRIAFSRRQGKKRESLPFHQLLDLIQNQHSNVDWQRNIYLVMGPEDDGLSAGDIQHCHYCARLPVYGDYGSYNISHAALLAMYTMREFLQNQQAPPSKPEVHEQPGEIDFERLGQWLELIGFNLKAPKKNALITLRRMLQRSLPQIIEVDVWNKVLNQTIRKLKGGDEN